MFGLEEKIIKPTIQSIAKKAQGALGLFTEALEELKETNREAVGLYDSNQEKIDLLEADNGALSNLISGNLTTISNIEDIFTPVKESPEETPED